MTLNTYRRWGTTVTAAGLITLVGVVAARPRIDADELTKLAAPFAFETIALPESLTPKANVAITHPDLNHISGWVSAVGASVAVGDLDGDGLFNDLCQTDPRTKEVLVMPAPTTGARFELFTAPVENHFDAKIGFPTGCMVGDFNEDGRDDLLVYFFGATPVILLRKPEVALGKSAFTVVRLPAPSGALWYTSSATQADLDGDGHLDLVFGNYFLDNSRMYDPTATDEIEMQDSFSLALNGGHNRIYLWDSASSGHATFLEVPDVLPTDYARAWTLALGAVDLNGDGLPELYFANDYGPDRLLLNHSKPGALKFEALHGRRGLSTPKSHVLGRDSFKGMGVDFADINGDLVYDIFVSNIAENFALQETHFLWVSEPDEEAFEGGVAPYSERSEALGVAHSYWGWDTRFGDFDNDGHAELVQATGFRKGDVNRWPELAEFAIGNDLLVSSPAAWPRFMPGDEVSGNAPNPFYTRGEGGGYHDISAQLDIGQPYVSRGVATTDVDGDGDLDLLYANQWEPSVMLLNKHAGANRFLGLHLVLSSSASMDSTQISSGSPAHPNSTWPAVGATAIITLPDGTQKIGRVDGGSGHSGDSAKTIHFGLGVLPVDAELKVELRWRDRGGHLRTHTFSATPGWHTAVLASKMGADS